MTLLCIVGTPLWRGDLSPLGCAATLNRTPRCFRQIASDALGAAAQPNGDKSPRHSPSLHF
ncbi:hypothetical protein C0J56_28110 [Pseudomonas fluorescens]|nr:hypothetical protein C0J56_28110 [Pseudomonas fluorescens]